MAKAGMRRHRSEPLINLLFAAIHGLNRPTYDMVLEYPFMELVQEIRRHHRENVAVWKVLPKWVNCTKAIFFELGRIVAGCLLFQHIENCVMITENRK